MKERKNKMFCVDPTKTLSQKYYNVAYKKSYLDDFGDTCYEDCEKSKATHVNVINNNGKAVTIKITRFLDKNPFPSSSS